MEGVGGDQIAQSFAPGFVQHRRTEVRADHGAGGAGGTQGQREIAAAGRKIENPGRLPAFHQPRRSPAPEKIHPTAEQVIGQVVAPGDH
jgi:hypothetical protein